jgi:hypothetical protein
MTTDFLQILTGSLKYNPLSKVRGRNYMLDLAFRKYESRTQQKRAT